MIKRGDEEDLDKLIGDLPSKYRYSYQRKLRSGRWHHRYAVTFPLGTVEVQYFKCKESGNWPSEYLGGVEVHYKNPPEYMGGKDPSQEHCEYLGGPCWHDGSSMAFDRFKNMTVDDENYFYLYLINRGEDYFGKEGFE